MVCWCSSRKWIPPWYFIYFTKNHHIGSFINNWIHLRHHPIFLTDDNLYNTPNNYLHHSNFLWLVYISFINCVYIINNINFHWWYILYFPLSHTYLRLYLYINCLWLITDNKLSVSKWNIILINTTFYHLIRLRFIWHFFHGIL